MLDFLKKKFWKKDGVKYTEDKKWCDVCKKDYYTEICSECYPSSEGKWRKGW